MTARSLAAFLLGAVLAGAAAASAATTPPARVMVYYFHGTYRCLTCIALEDATVHAVQDSFPALVNSGDLGLAVVDYDAPGHEHFVADFELDGPQAVLVAYDGAEVLAWQSLDRLWDLDIDSAEVEGYVAAATRAFLAAHPQGRGKR